MLIVYFTPGMVLIGVSKSTGNVNASPAEFVLTLKNSPKLQLSKLSESTAQMN
jgi:hypothetical protein